ncbi:hypothetical protein LTR28_002229, partial [Elasticomyces elasticus]
MADLATPSAAAISTMDAKPAKAPFTKPERPDEEQYKTELAKAEKELNASNERMVSVHRVLDKIFLVFVGLFLTWGSKDGD